MKEFCVCSKNANKPAQNAEFSTISEALLAIRAMRAKGDVEPVTLRLFGDHYITKPIVIDSSIGDGITLVGEGSTRIIGGVRLDNIRCDEISGIACMSADVPRINGEYPAVSDLYIDGVRYYPARYPKGRFLHASSVENELAPDKIPMEHAYFSSSYFSPIREDIEGMEDIAGASITFYHFWVDEHTPIAKYDAEKNIIYMKYPSCFIISTRYEPKEDTSAMRYYFENVARGFTDEGEFYYDRKIGKIYFIPKGDVTPNSEAFVPTVKTLLEIRGKAEHPIKNIKVENIEFMLTDGECAFSSSDGTLRASDMQAAYSAPGAVFIENACGCSVRNCKIHATGAHAVCLGVGNIGTVIEGCDMYDLGGGGVTLVGGTPENSLPESHHNKITKNRIINISKKLTRAVGVLIRHSHDDEISENEIAYTGYSGISVGWVWGYADSVTDGCLIARNHIHHIGDGRLSDMGGIYTLGRQPRTVIEYNRIHDVESAHYGGWGIYNDEGSSGIRVEGNVVFRTKCECYNLHYGKDNLVKNNIFALGGRGCARVLRAEEHIGATLTGNILVTDGLDIYYDAPGTRESMSAARNAVYDLSREVKMLTAESIEYALEDWQEKFNRDIGTEIITPEFRDLENGDFTVTNPEVFEKIGFTPIIGFPATE